MDQDFVNAFSGAVHKYIFRIIFTPWLVALGCLGPYLPSIRWHAFCAVPIDHHQTKCNYYIAWKSICRPNFLSPSLVLFVCDDDDMTFRGWFGLDMGFQKKFQLTLQTCAFRIAMSLILIHANYRWGWLIEIGNLIIEFKLVTFKWNKWKPCTNVNQPSIVS